MTIGTALAGAGQEAAQPEVGEGELDRVLRGGREGEIAGEGEPVPPGPGNTEGVPGARLSSVSLVAG